MTDSQSLLAEYARNGSDAAFRELVTRYVDLVYSTALRLVEGDTHRAEDVAQSVFVALARKARTLPEDVSLGGWLHRDTCFMAATLMRGERRRQARERQAVEMNALQNHSGADFSRVAPVLDEAINELGEADRAAILLRFFEQRDFRAVGELLGSTEDAARMRVTRALGKLQSLLKHRGVTTTAAGLSVVLAANAIQAAPIGLSTAITTAAAALATTATTATLATTTTMNWINMKSIAAIVTAALTAGTATHFVQQREADRLRNDNRQLVAEQDKLTGERDAALAGASSDKNELARLQKNQSELLRLRGEVGLLRRQVKELERLREENRRLQAGLVKAGASSEQTEAKSDSDPQRQVARAKMGLAKELLLGLMTHAEDNQGQYPTGFDQVLSVFTDPDATSQVWAIKNNPDANSTMLNQFEIVTPVSTKSVTNWAATIAIREKEPWLLNGKRVKVYGYADGHSQVITEPPEGFEAWEKQHMVLPQPSR